MKYKQIVILVALLAGSFFFWPSNDELSRNPASRSARSFPDYLSDHIYFSLADDLEIEGPIERTGDDGKYLKRVFGLLVQNAHKNVVKDWYFPEDGETKAYHSFLVNTLIVPYHESRLVHLRGRSEDRCSYMTNDVSNLTLEESKQMFAQKREEVQTEIAAINKEIERLNIEYKRPMTAEENRANRNAVAQEKIELKRASKRLRTLSRNERKAKTVINSTSKFKGLVSTNSFPSCNDKSGEHRQLLFSYDYADVGIMMFNMKAHPDVFESHDIFSTKKMIERGVRFLYSHYNRNLSEMNRSSHLSCIKNNGKLDYRNLIRSSWSNYNGGGYIKNSCRFHGSQRCLNAIKKRFDTAVRNRNNSKATSDDNAIFNKRNYLFTHGNAKFSELVDRYSYNSFSNSELANTSCNEGIAKNDWDYFDNMVTLIEREKSYYHLYLPKNSLEFYALNEIISNFKNGTNSRKYIDQVIATNYTDYVDQEYFGTTDLAVVDEVVNEQVNVVEKVSATTSNSPSELSKIDEEIEKLENIISQTQTVVDETKVQRRDEIRALIELNKREGLDLLIERIRKNRDELILVVGDELKDSVSGHFLEMERDILKGHGLETYKSTADLEKDLQVLSASIVTPKVNQEQISRLTELKEQRSRLETTSSTQSSTSVSSNEALAPIVIEDVEGNLPVKEEEKTYYLKGRGLNIRSSAGVSDKKCGNTRDLSRTSFIEIEVIGNLNDSFVKVRSPLFDEFSGSKCADQGFAFVSSRFIEQLDLSNGDWGVVVSDVKIRSHYNRGAWTNKEVLTRGERVLVLETKRWGDMWYYIVRSDGVRGWAWKNIELE